jgi:hypothetical protein
MVENARWWGNTLAILVFLFAVVIALWDVLALVYDRPTTTVSHILREWSRECVALAFIAGFIAGHIWGH